MRSWPHGFKTHWFCVDNLLIIKERERERERERFGDCLMGKVNKCSKGIGL